MSDDTAIAWIDALTARGVTLVLRGRRIGYHPKSAYGGLTDQERATLKAHKTAIVTALRDRYNGLARGEQVAPPPMPDAVPPVVPEPEPPQETCPGCNRAPCIGIEHPAFYALHPIEAQKRADAHATKVMLARVGRPHPWLTDY